jgi:mannose-6-phosphate isomerase-like protein (cupin superfamily)
MSYVPATVVKEVDARCFFEGAERCMEYLREGRMWFGTSMLLPGEEGALDPGHPSSVEVFYCCQGQVVVLDERSSFELQAGDALIIPEGDPHTLRNVGQEPALVVWAGAPGG